MRFLGYIPARGGSKGIPRKNLALLNGKPLLQYTIEAAKSSQVLDYVFLSTDDEEIISCAATLGITTEYRRPSELSDDRSLIIDGVLHALAWLSGKGESFDAVMLLQPTSPLRNGNHIDEAATLFLRSEVDTLISVHAMSEHPYECIRKQPSGWQWLAAPSGEVRGRQDYSGDFLFANGAIYIASIAFLSAARTFFHEGTSVLYEMRRLEGMDIDDEDQLALAECVLRLQKSHSI